MSEVEKSHAQKKRVNRRQVSALKKLSGIWIKTASPLFLKFYNFWERLVNIATNNKTVTRSIPLKSMKSLSFYTDAFFPSSPLNTEVPFVLCISSSGRASRGIAAMSRRKPLQRYSWCDGIPRSIDVLPLRTYRKFHRKVVFLIFFYWKDVTLRSSGTISFN